MCDTIDIIKYTLIQAIVLLLLWFGFYLFKDSVPIISKTIAFVPLTCFLPGLCYIAGMLEGDVSWGLRFYTLFYFFLITFGCYVLSDVPSLIAFIKLYF